MKKTVATILCILTLGCLVLMHVQKQARLFKLKPLNGFYYQSRGTVLSLNNLRDGSYQRSLEEDLRYNFGFREFLIRSYNQYLWDFYHKTLNKTICVGKDDWLYGRDEFFDREDMRDQFDREAMRLYKVQHILESYGNFVFVTMLPGKSLIYPEKVPDTLEVQQLPFHASQYYPFVFDSLGINYINMIQVFSDWKGKVDFPLYPKTGKHWTHLASAYAFDTIEHYIEKKGDMNLSNFTVGETYPDSTMFSDDDLEKILNLWRPIKPNQNYYAKVQLEHDSTATWPALLVVGDSYFWSLTQSVPLGGIFKRFQYWYYNSSVYYNEKCHHTSEADILWEVLNSRIIDLMYSPEQLYVFSNGFLPKVLLYLTHDDTEIDSTLQVIAAMVEDEEEIGLDKAKERLFSTPEYYFPDLASDTIPTTRNSRIPEIIQGRSFGLPN